MSQVRDQMELERPTCWAQKDEWIHAPILNTDEWMSMILEL